MARRVLAAPLNLWCLQLAYLILFSMQSSTFRLLLPLFPLVIVVAASRSRAYRWALLVAGACAQGLGGLAVALEAAPRRWEIIRRKPLNLPTDLQTAGVLPAVFTFLWSRCVVFLGGAMPSAGL